MAQPFRGVVNVDIRDSQPDWSLFEPPRAPEVAPNVVYVALDESHRPRSKGMSRAAWTG